MKARYIQKVFFCLAAALMSGCSTSPDEGALEAFKQGNYERADGLLTENRLRISAPRYSLDKAYIRRGSGRLNFSTAQLEQALILLPKGVRQYDPTRQEIYLNILLNDYLANDAASLKTNLEKSRPFFPKGNDWILLFSGLSSFMQEDYISANNTWSNLGKPVYYSPWMEAAFSKIFSGQILQNLQARAAILSGNYIGLRKKLEAEIKAKNNEHDQALLLLALTYFQEGREKGPAEAIPYFKTAFEYLERVQGLAEKYPQDLYSIHLILVKKIKYAIDNQNFSDLPFYIEAVRKWGTPEQISQLAQEMSIFALVNKNKWEKMRQIAPALDDIITNPQVRERLSGRYEELARESLVKGDVAAAERQIEMARTFSSDPQAVNARAASEVHVALMAIFRRQEPSLETARQMLEFWKSLDNSPAHRMKLAEQLLAVSKLYWNKAAKEKYAIALMRFAADTVPSNRQGELKKSMSKILDNAYVITIAQSNYDKLPYLLEAQQLFALDPAILADPKEIVNLEADAELLYKQRDYERAFLVAEWIANLEPEDESIQRLAGLSAYQLGRYDIALSYFSKNPVSKETLSAYAVSEMIAGDLAKGRKLLSQLGSAQNVPSEVYEKLALAELESGNPQSAIGWTIESPVQSPRLKLIQLLAYFQLGDYSQVLELYQKLPREYQQLAFINSAAAISAMRLGEQEETQDLIKELYENEQPAWQWKDPSFKKFTLNPEYAPSKYFAGALYYKEILKNPEKAAEQFARIQNHSNESLIEYTDVLLDLGKNAEALQLIQQALPQADKPNNIPLNRRRLYANYAIALERTGAYLESYGAWKAYWKGSKKDRSDEFIRSYVKTLAGLRLYRQVESELLSVPSEGLADEDKLEIMTARIRQANFKGGIQAAEDLLASLQPLAAKLAIAKAMKTAGDAALYQQALEGMPPSSQMDGPTAKAYLDFLIFSGDYDKAKKLYQEREDEFAKDPYVQTLLYRLYDALSLNEEAKKSAVMAGVLAPDNYVYSNFRVQYGDDDPFIVRLEEKYRPLYEKGALQPSGSLQYALALQEEALEQYLGGITPDLNQAASLRLASGIFNNLTRLYPEVPELHYYHGQALYLLDQKKEALSSIEKVIALDPSYAEALLTAGLIYSDSNDWPKAEEAFKKVVLFEPGNGKAWEKLGEVQLQLGNYLDAVRSFESAVRFRPNEAANYIRLGELRLQLNDPEEAIEVLEQALLLQPDDKKTLQLLLRALYDPNNSSRMGRNNDLGPRQQAVYEKLYKLDPKEAVELKKKLMNAWK